MERGLEVGHRHVGRLHGGGRARVNTGQGSRSSNSSQGGTCGGHMATESPFAAKALPHACIDEWGPHIHCQGHHMTTLPQTWHPILHM